MTLPRERHPPDNPLKDFRERTMSGSAVAEALLELGNFISLQPVNVRSSEKSYMAQRKWMVAAENFPGIISVFRDRLALPPSRPWDKQEGLSLWDHLQHPTQLRPEGRDKLWPGWVGWSFPGSYKNKAGSREKSHLHKLLTNPCHKCPGSEIHFTLKYQ